MRQAFKKSGVRKKIRALLLYSIDPGHCNKVGLKRANKFYKQSK
jgi:hypothetical protein